MESINLVPSWEATVGMCLAIIENGTAEGRATGIAELQRLGRIADSYIAAAQSDVIAEYGVAANRGHG